MLKKDVLSSGLRVVSKYLPNTQSVTVLILVGAGSRYEVKEISGISHFLEHMFFKGAEKYKNTKEVSEAIDSVGGDFNAFTGKEYAGYYVKVASANWKIAVDVLSDMLINSKFDPAEIDKERGVILEEYNMYQDTPMYQIGWDFERLMYGDQPLGWDQVGTKEVINSLLLLVILIMMKLWLNLNAVLFFLKIAKKRLMIFCRLRMLMIWERFGLERKKQSKLMSWLVCLVIVRDRKNIMRQDYLP
jgi:hypothetical protein